MCDYSLTAVKTRLAVAGESLLVHKFHTGCKGLASPADIQANKVHWIKRLLNAVFSDPFWNEINYSARQVPAVCIPPGARLRLVGIPKRMRRELEVGVIEDVIFTQKSPETHGYRDGFRFANGAEQIIQLFVEGLRVEVLSLDSAEDAETDDARLGAKPRADRRPRQIAAD